jgi:isoleucyl-tRNA synthetase
LNQVIQNVEDAYEKYEFYKIYHLLNNFVTVDLSAFYLDILKDRLYVRKKNGVMRRSSQTALYEITSCLARMMAPIMSFLAEETYQFLVGPKKESVFLEKYPQSRKEWENSEVLSSFNTFIEIRTEALKKLEELRKNKIIGASLEAQLHITAQPEQLKVLELLKDYLNELFIVSQVTVSKTPGELNVTATKANGEKCVRCWTYHVETNKNPKFPGICPKCVEALS